MREVLAGPLNFIDTSNEYGNGGDSERRIGQALGDAGGLPEGLVLATKVDPVVGSTDFSGDRVRRSVAESLERLGLDRLQLVHLHDQFSMRNPRVASTIVGLSEPGRVAQTLALATLPIAEDLWARLLPLAHEGRTGLV